MSSSKYDYKVRHDDLDRTERISGVESIADAVVVHLS